MLEMLGVLAIVGVLSAGGIAGYNMAMQSHKTNVLVDRVFLIAQRVRILYKNSDYTGLNSNTLIEAGMIGSSDIENPFGGTLSPYRDNHGDVYYFGISIPGVPEDTCVKIVTKSWGSTGVLHSIGVRANDGTTWKYPKKPEDAVTACEGNTRINWRFR